MPKIVDHDVRRRQIVEAASKLIAKHGLAGATQRKIAEESGWTTGVVTHYFSHHHEILVSVLRSANRDAAERMKACIESMSAPADRLIAVVREALPLKEASRREWRIWLAFWAAGMTDAALREENRRRYKEWSGLLRQLLNEARGEPMTPEHVKDALALIDGLGVQLSLDPSSLNRAQTERVIKERFAPST